MFSSIGLEKSAAASALASVIARSIALVSGVGVAILLVFTTTPAQSAPQPAKEADKFVDTIGVNVHLGYLDTVYAQNWSGVRDKLVASGIRHIRDHAYHASNNATDGANSTFYTHLRELGQYGIKANLTFQHTSAGLTYPLTTQDLADVAAKAGGVMEQIEGPNEVDNTMGTDYPTESRAYQQSLYKAAKGNPSTANLPVLAPSIARGCCSTTNATAIGDLSAYADKGNMHSYPGGQMPSESRLDRYYIPNAKTIAPGKPIQATETGYHNATRTTNGHLPASEKAAGKYMPRLFFEYFNRGIERAYPYEFVNEDNQSIDIERNFGLLRGNLSEKPAYTATKNLIALLKDPGASFTPGSLDYYLSGDTANVHSTLLQKRDGRFYLALWKEVSSWNVYTRQDISVSPSSVSLSLNTPTSGIKLYRPNQGITPTAQYGPQTQLNLSVPDEVLLVEVTPSKDSSPPDPEPTTEGVTSLTLVNADTEEDIMTLTDGAVVDFSDIKTRNLNVRANTELETVGSVRFDYDSNSNYRTESVMPYALAGDTSGDYNAWTPSVGSHKITAAAYTASGASGTQLGTPLTISFTGRE